MATLDRLVDALRQADAAGNVDDARSLADAIRQMQAEPPRETTAEEGLARGAAPYAMSMGAGALVGGGLGALFGGPIGAVGGAALGSRLAPAGLAAADAGTQLYNVFANRFGGRAVPTPANTLADIAGSVGVGRPGAPVAEAIGGGAAGAGTVAAGLRGLGGYVVDPVRRGVLNAMAAQPGLQSVAGGAGAGTAAALGEYAGVTDPLLLTLASIAAGGVTAPVAAAAGNLGVRGGNALVRQFGLRLDPAEAYRVDTAGGRGQQLVEALRSTPMSETGAPLTTAQASVGAEAPAYTAAMRRVTEELPETSTQLYQMEKAQAAARKSELAREAGTPSERAGLVARRDRQADINFGRVKDKLVEEDEALTSLFKTPAMREVLRVAKDISANRQEPFQFGQTRAASVAESPIVDASGNKITTEIPATFAEFPVKNMYTLKKAMDDLIADPATFGIGREQANAIKGVRGKFIDWLEDKVPEVGEARGSYRAASTPINQRKFMNFLEEKLGAPLSNEAERPGVFGAAVKSMSSERDAPAFLRRAIDNAPRYATPEEFLSPNMLQAIDNVRLDLARDVEMRRLVEAGRVSAGDPSKLASKGGLGEGLTQSLNPTIALINRVLKKNAGRLDAKLAMELALESLNPPLAAANLERALARQARLAKFQITPPGMMKPGAFAASQLPAVVNVMGQQNQNAMAR